VTTQKVITGFPKGLCSRAGKEEEGFFWSLAFPYGIKRTLGVFLGIIS